MWRPTILFVKKASKIQLNTFSHTGFRPLFSFIGVYIVFTLLTGAFGQCMFPYGLAVILSLFLLKIVDITILLPIGLWLGLRK